MRTSSTIERAYELARSGSCHNVDDILVQLKRERFEAVEQHLNGPSIRGALRKLIVEHGALQPTRPRKPQGG